MRTFQIGKDGKMVDMGEVPCEWDIQAEFDRPPLLNYGQDNRESEIDSDPFQAIVAPCHPCGICGNVTPNFVGEFCLQCVPGEEDEMECMSCHRIIPKNSSRCQQCYEESVEDDVEDPFPPRQENRDMIDKCDVCGRFFDNHPLKPLHRCDPFPPLAPEPTTDTAADRVLDAAMRSRIPKTNEVLFGPIGVNSMTILHEMARNQGKSFIALGDGAGGGRVYRIIGHNVCKPHCKISDMDDKEASRATQME